MNNLILGAGITGLSAGFKTGDPIYESKNKPGGICRSYYRKGYRFEKGGGHWVFGDIGSVKFINRRSNVRAYERQAGVYINKIFPYPIQTYLEQPSVCASGSMSEWMTNNFGNTLCHLFFHPFNDKYLDGYYQSVIQENAYKSPRKGKGYNSTFYYPIDGLDKFIDSLAKESEIHYNMTAVKIDINNRVITFLGGEKIEYDELISTIPLNRLLDMCGLRGNLPYTSVEVVNIGAERGKNCPKDHWIYVPYSRENYFRIGFYSNVDPSFAPEGKVAIYVEGHNPMSDRKVVAELQDLGFIGDVDVVSRSSVDVGYTWRYPRTNIKKHLNTLRKYGIKSIGRYGAWKFQGIAESIQDGLSL